MTIVGGQCYKYVVTATNVLGGESEESNSVKVTPHKAPSGMSVPTEVTHDQTSITV